MPDTPPQKHPGGTIDIAGHKVKKNQALLAGAAAAGVVIIAVMRKRSAAAAAAATSAAAMVTDPAGNQCATLDPSTGYCPGTAADVSAQQSAGISSADEGGLSGGASYYEPSGTGTSATGSAVPSFTDNASWGQYAETALGSNGSDAVAAAIAKYLAGSPVTAEQQTTIEEAIAIANYPPVTGPNGDPPSMTLIATSSTTPGTCPAGTAYSATQTGAAGETAAAGGSGWCEPAAGTGTGTGTGTTAMVTIPVLKGKTTGTAHNILDAAGLHALADPGQKDNWIVTGTNPGAGRSVAAGSTVVIAASAPPAAPKK